MYTIEEKPFGDFTQIIIKNPETQSYVSIVPQFGANVNELSFTKNGKSFSIIEGDSSSAALVKNEWYRSAVLIPFPNRLDAGTYSFEGKTHKFPINIPSQNNALHGSLFNKPFSIVESESGETDASVTLRHKSHGEIEGFPFKFDTEIRYTFADNELVCEIEITNTDAGNIPMGLGWHPYFKTGSKVNELLLQMPDVQQIDINERMLPTGKTINFDKFKNLQTIDEEQLDTGFKILNNSKIASTKLIDKRNDLSIEVWQETGKDKFNYVQIFIPPHRQSIAIEPMTCNIDAFNNNDGLKILKPGEKLSGKFGIIFS